MSKPRKREWTFREGTIGIAAELTIPYSRLYNALTPIGLKAIGDEEDLKAVALQLQKGAIPFQGLIKIFGPSITLGQLEALEAEFRAPQAVAKRSARAATPA